MNTQTTSANQERPVKVGDGWLMLPLLLGMFLGSIALLIYSVAVNRYESPFLPLFLPAILALPLSIVLMTGLFTLQPNEARVLVLFGEYRGTVRDSGFHWGNPFYSNGP